MTHPIKDPAPVSGNGWTPERKVRFLDLLALHGNARAACRAVGLSAEAAYKLRRRDPLFARAWAAARVLGRENCCQALGERALEGVEEEIYYRGELIGTRRRYDSRLLLAHLARLDRLADETAAGEDARRFDDLLACIAEESDSEPVLDRAKAIEDAAAAVEEYRREQVRAHDDAVMAASPLHGARSFAEEKRASAIAKLDRDCAARMERARTRAAEDWDRRRADALAIVDALTPVPEAPGTAEASAMAKAPAARSGPLQARLERPFPAPAVRLPCTMSTASTSALALSLAAAGRLDRPPPGPRTGRW